MVVREAACRLLMGDNLPGQGEDYLKPLNGESDAGRYLDVDSAQERFAEFTAMFDDPVRWTGQGHLTIVTGDRGYGKTSLIMRCISWLQDRAASLGRCRVVPVDMSDERWSPKAITDRMNETLSWILAELAVQMLVAPEEQAAISARADLAEKFRDLGQVLGSRVDGTGKLCPVVLAVVLDGYPTPDELALYYNNARPGMFFFAEVYDEEYIRKIAVMRSGFNRRHAASHLLRLDVLKPGDPANFVNWIRHIGGNRPEIPNTLVDDINKNFIPTGIGMGELAKMTWGAIDNAAAENASQVTAMHIVNYYRGLGSQSK